MGLISIGANASGTTTGITTAPKLAVMVRVNVTGLQAALGSGGRKSLVFLGGSDGGAKLWTVFAERFGALRFEADTSGGNTDYTTVAFSALTTPFVRLYAEVTATGALTSVLALDDGTVLNTWTGSGSALGAGSNEVYLGHVDAPWTGDYDYFAVLNNVRTGAARFALPATADADVLDYWRFREQTGSTATGEKGSVLTLGAHTWDGLTGAVDGAVTISSATLSPATSTQSGGVTTQTYTGTATLSDSSTRALASTDGTLTSTAGTFGTGANWNVLTDPAGTGSAQTLTITLDVPANGTTGQAHVTATAARTIPAVTASSITLGCGPTATLIDGQTLALMPVVGPSGSSQAVDYTISPAVGSINASNVYLPPPQGNAAQTVTITAKPAGMSSPSAQVVVTIPSNTPTIRVLDGVTPVANGGTVAVLRQAGAAVSTRYVYVDNGSGAVSGGDNALTGLSVSMSPAVSWLAVALNQTTAGAVLSLTVTSPTSVPGTADPDVTVTVSSTVTNVAARTFIVPGTVAAAAAAGSLTLAQLAQFNRIEQMLLPVSSGLGNLSALGGVTQDKFNQVLAAQFVPAAGDSPATTNGVAATLTPIAAKADAAKVSADTAAASAASAASTSTATATAVGNIPPPVSANTLGTTVIARLQAAQAFAFPGATVANVGQLTGTMPDGTTAGHINVAVDAGGGVIAQSTVIAGAPGAVANTFTVGQVL